MDIQKSFGLRVQQLRKALGVSQEKFALSIDMDRTYLAYMLIIFPQINLPNHMELLLYHRNDRWNLHHFLCSNK